MKVTALGALSICLLSALACSRASHSQPTTSLRELLVSSPSGLAMRVAEEDSDPTLWLSVPGEAAGQNAVLVLIPEHVTVRRHGANEAEHLYLWRPGDHGARPHWLRTGNACNLKWTSRPAFMFWLGLLSSKMVFYCTISSSTTPMSISIPFRQLQTHEWFRPCSTTCA